MVDPAVEVDTRLWLVKGVLQVPAACLLLISALGWAEAHAASALVPGQPLHGALTAADPRSATGAREDRITFEAQAGQGISLALESEEFDAFLRLITPGGAELANDDAAVGTTDARIETTLTESGRHTVVVTTFIPTQMGRYTLTLETRETPPMAAPSPSSPLASAAPVPAPMLSIGVPVEGELGPGDVTSATGQFEDRYQLQGTAGQTITIALDGRELDPLVQLITPSGQGLADDDSGPGANALLTTTLAESGPHTVVATSFRAGAAGRYTLTVSEGAPSAAPALSLGGSTLALGQPLQGQLGPGDERLSNGEYMDRHIFQGTAGQTITITMTSDAIDPYLIFVTPSGYQRDDDDAGGGLDAQITATITEDGPHQVIATTFAPGESGPYTLVVTEGAGGSPALGAFPPPSAGAAPLAIGQSVHGALVAGDEQRRGGALMDRYAFAGQPGQTVEVQLRSEAFDPYLCVSAPDGTLLENDDGGDGLSARVVMPLTQAGPHQIIVTGFSSDASGPYTLELRPLELPPNTPGGAIEVGQRLQGFLGPGDPQVSGGQFCDEYTVEVTAGQRLQIRLASGDFDPYLIWVDPSGAQRENDDHTGLNAGLDVVVVADGTARIGASTLSAAETGVYTLTVRAPSATATGAIAGSRPPERIALGQTRRGTLGPGDGLMEGAWVDAFTFIGRAGQTVTATMTSSQVQPLVIVCDPSGNQSPGAAVNAGESQVSVTLQTNGFYTVLCRSAGTNERGNYTLTLR